MSEKVQTQSNPTNERGLRWTLIALCLTQITSWGVLYYAFSVLSVRISARTGWSPPAVTAAFSGGLVTSALVGVIVGRWLDRHGPRGVMTAGAVAGPLAVVGVALAPTFPWFVAAWIAAGVAMAAVLYPPAFAALTRWFGPRHVGALTILTLVAGLSSTVFAPLTAALADRLDWRTTYLALAALLAAVTIPAHFFGLRHPWPAAPGLHISEPPSRITRSRPFVALAVALTVAVLASYSVIVNLVPLMTEHGIDARMSATALGLGGIGQVFGRLGYRTLIARFGIRARVASILAGVAVTTALLGIFSSVVPLIVMAILAGFVRGIMTLLQATAVTERWGHTHYGHLNGVLSAPVTLATATSPWIGAALASWFGGYGLMFIALGAFGALGAVIGLASVPARSDDSDVPHLSPSAHAD